MPCLRGEGVALAGVEQQLGGLSAQSPQSAWALNPVAAVAALEAAFAGQIDGRIVGADGDADLRVGRRGAALCCGYVRAAFEQLRRNAQGDVRQGQIERRKGNAETRQLVVGDRADGVLKLCARHSYVDQLRAGGFELGLRLGYVDCCRHAAFQTALRQVELPFEIGDGRLEQFGLRVETAQLEIIGGQGSLQAEVYVGHIRGAGLRIFMGHFDGAANTAPEIGLPTSATRELEVVVVAGCGRRYQRFMLRIFVVRDVWASRQCWI